jgi:16S rRNA (uracil1498-N3)-methyltransferase
MPEKIITLGIPLIKEQKMDLILQKATELGAWSFQPFICQRSIREKPSTAKKERWMKIVQEATRQSERLWLAQINDVIDFSDLIKREFGLKLAASIEGQKIMDIPKAHVNRTLLLIGPEGDFSAEEYEKLKTESFSLLKLSENILRVETASIIASGLIAYFFA